jgi:hypothetical protein
LEFTLEDLQRALEKYVDWYCRKNGQNNREKVRAWANAVARQAKINLEQGLQYRRRPPVGYPGLKEEIREAQSLLVFAPDDRAPHATHVSCKNWYKSELQKRLQRVDVYVEHTATWEEFKCECAHICELNGFMHREGMPYLYGIWSQVATHCGCM